VLLGNILDVRRDGSAKRLHEFQSKLDRAKEIAGEKACVYITGSFGRAEASTHSDLDVFIVGDLSNLDQICLKAELIQAVRDLNFPEFSKDGKYLEHRTVDELVKTTGMPDDDANNTFTARLLLLLESKPLLGDSAYVAAIDEVIAKYWGDYEKHKSEFVPAFLGNDIIRLWRTFCVNYEAGTSRQPPKERDKRRLKNYKLKYSRLLTCYSGLVFLLTTYNKFQTVRPEDVREMVKRTPTQRLEQLLQDPNLSGAQPVVTQLLVQYEQFLQNTDADEVTMLERIADPTTRFEYFEQARGFGDTMFDLIEELGHKSRFHKLFLV
jgi:hypothetical protein